MYNGDVGGVGGDNTQWNKKLAEELDAADGNKDGKISAEHWNGFLNSIHSNGNKIKNFINIENAAKSFAFYDSKKDVGKVDYSEWKSLLNVYLGKTDDVENASEPTTQPGPNPDSDVDKIRKEKNELDEALSKSPLSGLKTLEDFSKMDKSKFSLVEGRGANSSRFVNSETGEDILLETDETGKNGTITYTSDGVKHTIKFVDGKFTEGTIETKQADNAVKSQEYIYDTEGKAIPKTMVTNPTATEEPSKEELQSVVDGSPLLSDSIPKEEDLLKAGYQKTEETENGTVKYENPQTGEKIEMTKGIGKGGRIYGHAECSYTKDNITMLRLYNFSDGSVVDENGMLYIEKEDGSKADVGGFYKNELTGVYEVLANKDLHFPVEQQEELQSQVDNLPFGKDKMPTEDELLKAGYKKNETIMTSNGGILYENPQTGESIILDSAYKTFDYSNGNVKITQFYGDDDKPASGLISVKGEKGAFAKGNIKFNSETGKMEVELTQFHKEVQYNVDQAKEALEFTTKKILDFANSLNVPKFILPDINTMIINNTTGVGYAEKTSEDGNFKAKLEVDNNGSIKITYLQKQSDGNFMEIGSIDMEKTETTSSLRGYDYNFATRNHITGDTLKESSINWT